MLLRHLLSRSETVKGLGSDIRRIRVRLWQNSSRIAIERYVASHEVRKLHLGAGPIGLPGWFNTDLNPQSSDVVYLDVRKPFFIDNETFDYIFSEHLIEHISWSPGLHMLRECRRVLKPGGTLRIATPDLAVLLGLYGKNRDELGERYIRWVVERSMKEIGHDKASVVINSAFRNHGHQFLYDADLLQLVLQQTGFTNIRRCNSGQSDDENLRGIDSHGMKVGDAAMAAFETMVFEADRPKVSRESV